MKIRSLLALFIVVSIASLATGYMIAGYWMVLLAIPAIVVLYYAVRWHSVVWASSIYLFSCTLLAAVGMIIRLQPVIMIVAVSASLASWDLMHFNQDLQGVFHAASLIRLKKHHLNSLWLATSAGLFLALIGASLSLRLSFALTLLLALLAIGSLLFGVRYMVDE